MRRKVLAVTIVAGLAAVLALALRPNRAARLPASSGKAEVALTGQRGRGATGGERAIQGRVVYPDGAPMVEAQVSVTTREGGSTAARRRLVSDDRGAFDAGRFEVAEFLVTATLAGRPDARTVVDLRDPQAASEDVVLTMPECSSQLSGLVFDGSGGPIAGARVAERELWGVTMGVESGADGSYALCTRDSDVLFQVTASGYGSLEFKRVVRGKVRQDLVLVPEGVIEGRVVDGHGQPVEAIVEGRVRSYAAEHPAPRQTRADAGSFRLDGLAEGRWVVEAHNLHGRTRDGGEILVRAGQTITDVTLVLEDCYPLAGTVSVDGAPLDAAVVSAFSLTTVTVSPTVPAVDGAFELPCVASGGARIRVDGYEVLSPRSVVHAANAKPVAVTVATLGRIRGRVLRGGQPVAGAVVWYSGGQRPPGSTRTDAGGEYEVRNLVASTYRLGAESGSARSAEISITLTARQQAQLDLILTAETALSETVTSSGRPVGYAVVTAARDDGKDDGIGTTDAMGRFEISGLAGDGTYAVTAVMQAGMPLPIANGPSTRLAAGGAAEVAVEVTVPQDVIAGRVVDPRGAPVPDAAVMAVMSSDDAPRVTPWFPGSRTTTADDGRFRFAALPRGTYALRATTAAGDEGIVTRIVSPAERVQLVVHAGGSIVGTLEGFAVTPQITAKRVDASVETSNRGLVDGATFRIEGLAPGRYLVTAQSASDGDAATIQVTAGRQTPLTLRSSGHGTVRGHVREYGSQRGIAGDMCNLVVRDGDLIGPPMPVTLVNVDDDGGFVFRDVPAGDVVISCVGNGATHSSGLGALTLPPGGDLERDVIISRCDAPLNFGLSIDFRRVTPLAWIVASGGAADRAGVRRGDEIVAIDGVSVEGMGAHAVLCAVLNRSAGEQVRVGLRRGGTAVEVTIH
ncbi:MAG: carboxypeptidase regulatory-like domain-containing protein [Myxococcales bacterium]|nr:carboxypeptidase regulatory-like domain-containing protein [Myxococcales bacterium]